MAIAQTEETARRSPPAPGPISKTARPCPARFIIRLGNRDRGEEKAPGSPDPQQQERHQHDENRAPDSARSRRAVPLRSPARRTRYPDMKPNPVANDGIGGQERYLERVGAEPEGKAGQEHTAGKRRVQHRKPALDNRDAQAAADFFLGKVTHARA